MRFVKEHLVGLILGVILYEMYFRSQSHTGGSGR